MKRPIKYPFTLHFCMRILARTCRTLLLSLAYSGHHAIVPAIAFLPLEFCLCYSVFHTNLNGIFENKNLNDDEKFVAVMN